MKTTLEIIIKAPLEATYELFSDIKDSEQNIQAIEKIEMLDEPSEFIGTRWKETRTEFGKQATVEMWVSDAKENEFYEVESFDHGVHYLSRYDFEEVDANTTKVIFTFEGKPQTLGARIMSIMFIFFAGTTRKLFFKDMQDLKNILEA